MADATPDLFAEQEAAALAERREKTLRSSWDTWGWPGPVIGGMCEIDEPCPKTLDGGRIYAYTELARLVGRIGADTWIAEIAMPEPWGKNGRRVVLDRHWIGPPRRLIIEARKTA